MNVWDTSDMAHAAYVWMRSQYGNGVSFEVKFLSSEHSDRKFLYLFEDPKQICDTWVKEFMGSESQRYDFSILQFRKMTGRR